MALRTLSQSDVEQWIADHGGADNVQFTRETVQVPNPAADVLGHPDQFAPGAPTTIAESRLVWSNSKTKAKLSVVPQGEGSYEERENVGADPQARSTNPADTASNSPADRALDAEKQREREWNRDNGGLYETHAERKTREANETKAAEAATKTTPGPAFKNKDNQWVRPVTDSKGNVSYEPVPPEAIPNDPNADKYQEVKQDPASGKWWGLKADGKGWAEMPGGPGAAPPAPHLVDLPGGGKANLVPDATQPSGFRVEPLAETKPTDVTINAGRDVAAPGQVDQWLTSVWNEIDDQWKAGKITGDQAKAKFAPYFDRAKEMRLSQQQTVTNANTVATHDLTQRAQDQGVTTNRLNEASANGRQAISSLLPLLRYLPKNADSAAIVRSLGALMSIQQANVTNYGGLANAPRVLYPTALEATRNIDSAGYPATPTAPPATGAPTTPSVPGTGSWTTPASSGPLADAAGLAAGNPANVSDQSGGGDAAPEGGGGGPMSGAYAQPAVDPIAPTGDPVSDRVMSEWLTAPPVAAPNAADGGAQGALSSAYGSPPTTTDAWTTAVAPGITPISNATFAPAPAGMGPAATPDEELARNPAYSGAIADSVTQELLAMGINPEVALAHHKRLTGADYVPPMVGMPV